MDPICISLFFKGNVAENADRVFFLDTNDHKRI